MTNQKSVTMHDKYLDEEKHKGEDYDNRLESIVDAVKGSGHLTKDDLTTLSHWARNRSTYRIESHTDDFIKEKTGFALSLDTAEPDRINRLLELDGVGWMVASAILHWFHQDDYPIWSPPARNSVGIDNNSGAPKRGEWEAYVKLCRKLAKKNGVDMRTLDRALWKYSESGGA